MFDRFIRLARARKALRDGRFEDALMLAADPLIQRDRRAEQVRGAAATEMLARARRHLETADVAAARACVQCVRTAAPNAEAEAVAAAVETAANGERAATDLARRTLAEVRKLLDHGETAAAMALLATVSASPPLLERKQLEQLAAERQRRASDLCSDVAKALDAGDVDAAIEGYLRVLALDRDGPAVAALRGRLFTAAAAVTERNVRRCSEHGDVRRALDQYRAALSRLPGLADADALDAMRESLARSVLLAFAGMSTVEEAAPLAAAVRAAGLVAPGQLAGLAEAITEAACSAGAQAVSAAEKLRAAAGAAGADGLQRAASELAAAAVVREAEIQEVRLMLSAGQLDAARTALAAILARQPAHQAARRELDLVEQGLADLERRLETARAAARAGRLREACTLALSLSGSARVAADAAHLLADVQERMHLVDRGLDEVRVALHGSLAAGVEGVRHCLRRLQELAKVQVDHEEVPRVIAAVEAEIEALSICERAADALDRRAIGEAFAEIEAMQPLASKLLARDRLDARVCSLADLLRICGEAAVAGGRLEEVERCADLFERLRPEHGEFRQRAQELRDEARRRHGAAEGLVAAAEACLDRRDLAEAEKLAEAAQLQSAESASVRRLVAALDVLRRQADAIDRVESMADQHDYVGAQRKLATMPPTPPLLRTRIYDMKQNLARAQGLEGAFLLRVDEGGEHVVLRGDNVCIGNIRQTRSDLPVLANLAGRHAGIRRSLSFHGGMQDTIVAEEGEVRVRGERVERHTLAPGDRVQLGPSFAFVYRRPSSRSLSASLLLQGGFQVAGTDRVLLLKDRGRDGRILLGPGADAHVRVPRAAGEVEVFANNAGQMRVNSPAGGTIDKVPFRGEHPLAAGQVVEAAGISFVLLPWHPQA